jgi:death on curing protein
MKEPEWLPRALILAIHDEQLAEHGGGVGVRDEGLLDSALSRPRNRYEYDENTDLASLAAAYVFGIAKNHPFIDGNKRTAFVAAEVFLDVNGLTLAATDQDCVITMLRLASGEIDEDTFATWLRTNAR